MNQQVFQKIREAIIQIKEKNPYYLVAAIIVSAVLLDFFCVMQFQIRTLTKVNTKTSAFDHKIKRLEENIENFQGLENTVKNLDKQLLRLSRMVHRQQDVPDMLEKISKMANEHKVIVEEMLPETRFDKPVLTDKKRKYYSLPLTLNVKSGYHEFAAFLNALEKAGVVANIVELDISSSQRDTHKHKIRLVFNIIVFEGEA